MAQYSRRDFLKTGLAAAAPARRHRKLLAESGARNGDGLGNAREIRRQGDAARLWHRDHERSGGASWDKTNLRGWSVTPTIAAFASLRPLSPTARCTGCSAWR